MRRAVLSILAVASAAPVAAQTQTTAPAMLEFHLGSFTLKPRLNISEVGTDSNIFNDPENPKDDFTATITPRLDADLDANWGRLRSSTFVDFVYFHEFEDERSFNRGADGRFEFVLDRFRPYVSGAVLDTHARMNSEIDARAHRREWRAEAGLWFALTARTMIVAGVRRGSLQFDDDEVFRGVDLANTLNSTLDFYETGLRFELTPVTTFQITGSSQRDRFDTAANRDATTFRISPTLEFSPSALVSGRLTLGYTNFEPESASLAGYSGFTALASLVWAGSATKIEGTFDRDVRYSYEEVQPYYLTTGGRLTVTQMIAGALDVQGIVGRQRLEYRSFEPLDVAPIDRTDTVISWGGGVGYHLGETVRLGFNVEWTERDSPLPSRTFDRRRLYGTLTYGY
jgi:hypothetical protein